MKRFMIFAGKCAVVFGGALLLLFILNNRYKKVMENPYADAQKFQYMDSVYTDIQICNIGSSHGEYAFYYEELSKQLGYECFNFAMSSQTYDYDAAILSMYREHFADDCLMFIPVSCFSFNNEVTNEAEQDFLSAKYYTFLSPKYIPDYDPYVDIVTHRLPVLSAGADIVKLLPSLSLQAFAAEKSPSLSVAEFQSNAADRYHRHMENKEEYFMQERIDNLYHILDFCKENGITPVLITPPYTDYYSTLFPAEFKEDFRRTIEEITQNTGVSYYNYSEDTRFTGKSEYFADADHLNPEGAAYFMNIIQKEIPEFQEFLQRTAPNHKGDPAWEPPC